MDKTDVLTLADRLERFQRIVLQHARRADTSNAVAGSSTVEAGIKPGPSDPADVTVEELVALIREHVWISTTEVNRMARALLDAYRMRRR